jgi:hypothetical protein
MMLLQRFSKNQAVGRVKLLHAPTHTQAAQCLVQRGFAMEVGLFWKPEWDQEVGPEGMVCL